MKVALIIGRKKSKRIPFKNRKIFCGQPMILWPIRTLKKSKMFDKIYLSTDDDKIAKIAKKQGVQIPFMRQKKLSNDSTSTIEVVKDFIKKIYNKRENNFKTLCCVYASAPFFTVKDLKITYKYLEKPKIDFSFIVTYINNIFLRSFSIKKKKILLINKKFSDYRSQDLPNCYVDSGQFYWGKTQTWLKRKSIFKAKILVLKKKENSYIDINKKKEWKLAEKIFKKNVKL